MVSVPKGEEKRPEMSKNPILDELTYDPSSGALSYKGVRYLLIRPETIAQFQRAILRNCGQDSDRAFFEGGFAGGRLSAKRYKELLNFSDNEIIAFMMHMGSQIGWGRFMLERFDLEKRILQVSVTHSPFAAAYGRSDGGVCHLTRGVLAGMASVLFDKDCTSAETECLAKGDERCLFVVKG